MPKSSDKAGANSKTSKVPEYYDEFPEDEIHTMQALTGFKRQNGTDYYLVKWEGYSDTEQTWEPFCNILKPTPEILRQMEVLKQKYFEKTRKRKRVRDLSGGEGSGRRGGPLRNEKATESSKRAHTGRLQGLPEQTADESDEATVTPVSLEIDEDERPLMAAPKQKKDVDMAAAPTPNQERLSKRRRQASATVSDDNAAKNASPRAVTAGLAKSVMKESVTETTVKDSPLESQNSDSRESESKGEAQNLLQNDSVEKVEILSLVVHKSSLQSKGLKEFGDGPLGLELVDNPNISVQLIIKKGEDTEKEIFSLDYVKSKYPMELLDFMLAQVQYYRAAVKQ